MLIRNYTKLHNDMVCNTSDSSIEGLIEELQNLYTNKNALLWPKLNTKDYYYKTEHTDIQ